MGTSNGPDDAKDNVGAGSNNSDDDNEALEMMTTSTKTSTSYLAAFDDREFNGNFELNEITIEKNNLMEVSSRILYYHHCHFLFSFVAYESISKAIVKNIVAKLIF